MSSQADSTPLTRFRSRHVVTPEGVLDAVVEVAGGRITAVATTSTTGSTDAADLGDLWLLPGLVDTHVHINDPGRAEWEGFPTATRAAAAGGVTTLVDMPLNSVPATCSAGALAAKIEAARGHCHVDVAFWGGVIPGNAAALDGLAAAGVRGFKCFLSPSGVGEFPNVDESDLRLAMPAIARLGLPLLAHAEDPRVLAAEEAHERARHGD
ncbi:MAG: amidohydrolase family protein, partial [Candidatus Eisenbacteria bacterium]